MTPDPLRKRELAADLFDDGARQADVARALGISRATALSWHRIWRRSGREGLIRRRRRGPRPRLDRVALAKLDAALAGSPRATGLPVDAWSLAAVALWIDRNTGVRYHRRHIGRLLRRLGWIIPPYGPNADVALRGVASRDPDGNPLLLIRRRGDGSIP